MINNKKVLAVITARGGSKGILGKNIKSLQGKPLIAWTIEAANNAAAITECIVSTDAEDIADVARAHGANVPFIRPAELAESTTPHLPVMQHAVEEMERQTGERYDIVVILQPTSPLRSSKHIDETVTKLAESDADSAVTVFEVDSGYHPMKIKKIVDGYIEGYCMEEVEGTRRQDIPPAYKRSGCVYAMTRECLMDKKRLYGDKTVGVIVPSEWVVDIDEPKDWRKAEELAEKYLNATK